MLTNQPAKTYTRRSLGSLAPPQLPEFSEIDLSLGSIGSQAWVSTKDKDFDSLKANKATVPVKQNTTPPLSPKKPLKPSSKSPEAGSPKKKVSFQVTGLSEPSEPPAEPEAPAEPVPEPPSAPQQPQRQPSNSLSESGEVLSSKSAQSSGPSSGPSPVVPEAVADVEEPALSDVPPAEYVPITQAPAKSSSSSSEPEASPEPKKTGKRKAPSKKEKPAKRVAKPEKKPARKTAKGKKDSEPSSKKTEKGKTRKFIELDLSSPKKDSSKKEASKPDRRTQKEKGKNKDESEEEEEKEASPKPERPARKRPLTEEASPKRQKITTQPPKSAGLEEIVQAVWEALPSNYPMVEVPEKTKRLIKPEKLSGLFRGFSVIITGMKEDELDATLVLLLQKAGAKILDHPDEILNAARHEEASPKKKSPVKLPPRVLLLADKDHRTSKFLLCLASGLPCLHFNWAFHSVRQNCLIPDWEQYLLPSGFSSIENKKVFL